MSSGLSIAGTPQDFHITASAGRFLLLTSNYWVCREGGLNGVHFTGTEAGVPPVIISAHISKYKENPSFTPDTAKSCKEHGEEEATVSTLREILE